MAETRMERPDIWGSLAEAPDIQEKIRVFEQMIPAGVESIVDVGCGDGAITDALARRWRVTGVDSSRTALSHVSTEAVLADARDLPFGDRAFDLGMSSQMLEHLGDDAYGAVIDELRRVSGEYLLISVPYDEDLGVRLIRCPRCGRRQHVWGHVRRFTAESLVRDLGGGFEAVDVRVFGDIQPPRWPRPLLWAVNNVARGWYSPEGQHAQCERCGNDDFAAMRRFPGIAAFLKVRYDRVLRRPRMPYWLVVLARRAA
jgi:SAM-dependent methyltransferase